MNQITNISAIENDNLLASAWEEFIETGELHRHVPRSVITDSWLDCRKNGVDPHSMRANSVMSADELELRLNKDDLGLAGMEVLNKMSVMAEGTEHVIVLANSEGQIMHSVGHDSIYSKLEKINFMPGGDWSTKQVGPNGVGTPISLNRPELIFGKEHYCEAWQPWVCYGAPVHDSLGNVLGAIDITGPARSLKAETLSLAVSIAHSVESGLSLLSLKRREKLRTLYRDRRSHYGSDRCLLVDEFGMVQDLDPNFPRVFRWDEKILWKTPVSVMNNKLWKLIEKAIDSQEVADYEYHNYNSYNGVRLTVEPLVDSRRSLGAIVILTSSIGESSTVGEDNRRIDDAVKAMAPVADDLKTHSDQLIKETLVRTNGNISKAARILGINRTTIYRRLDLLKH